MEKIFVLFLTKVDLTKALNANIPNVKMVRKDRLTLLISYPRDIGFIEDVLDEYDIKFGDIDSYHNKYEIHLSERLDIEYIIDAINRIVPDFEPKISENNIIIINNRKTEL